eukprot:544412-Rhodomonas_salina.1
MTQHETLLTRHPSTLTPQPSLFTVCSKRFTARCSLFTLNDSNPLTLHALITPHPSPFTHKRRKDAPAPVERTKMIGMSGEESRNDDA